MTDERGTPAARYDALIDYFQREDPLVQDGRGFGAQSLVVNGKIFALLVDDRLVVKLPRDRVTALIDDGEGGNFAPGDGRARRVWKAWLALDPASALDWPTLAAEARDYVRGRR